MNLAVSQWWVYNAENNYSKWLSTQTFVHKSPLVYTLDTTTHNSINNGEIETEKLKLSSVIILLVACFLLLKLRRVCDGILLLVYSTRWHPGATKFFCQKQSYTKGPSEVHAHSRQKAEQGAEMARTLVCHQMF